MTRGCPIRLVLDISFDSLLQERVLLLLIRDMDDSGFSLAGTYLLRREHRKGGSKSFAAAGDTAV